jgi:Peptidyl-tRNA hydrolase PTH2
MPPQNRRPGPSLSRRGRSPGASASRSAVVPLRVMKLTLVVRVDLGLGRGKFAAQVVHAAVVSALANLGTSDFRA